MIHHLLALLKLAFRNRSALFWPIWMGITAVGVMLAVWVVPGRINAQGEAAALRESRTPRSAVFFTLFFLSLFLAFYVAGTLSSEDFTYYDNSHFTDGTLAGHNIPRQVAPGQGRFWPLGFQEFNLLRHFTSSVAGYHAFRLLQLLLLCGILLVLDEALPVPIRVVMIVLALITPGILISFTGLIYPEANVIFFLVLLAWFVKRFEQTHSAMWSTAAIVSAQFLLYYKELAFLLLAGFGAGRLMARCWRSDRTAWELKRLRVPESRLDLCFLGLASAFLIFYIVAMFPNYHTGYADEFRLPLKRVLGSYLQLDLLVWVFVVVVVTRIILIARHQIVPSTRWEGLALAGVTYFAGYVFLRMSSAYYLAPVDLIAILYLGRLTFPAVGSMGLAVRITVLAIVFVICIQDLSFSAFRVYERKNVVHAKAELGHAIKARYESDPQQVKRLFFPFAEPFSILEFASYLNYIGVPVQQSPVNSDATKSVVLVGATVEKDGPCGYRTFVCHSGKVPDRGDLVVVLPDDFTQAETLSSLQSENEKTIFSYQPWPVVASWFRPYLGFLHTVSPVFSNRQLPDFWLNAFVAIQQ